MEPGGSRGISQEAPAVVCGGFNQNVSGGDGEGGQILLKKKIPLIKLWRAIDCKMHSEFIDVVI